MLGRYLLLLTTNNIKLISTKQINNNKYVLAKDKSNKAELFNNKINKFSICLESDKNKNITTYYDKGVVKQPRELQNIAIRIK